MRYHSIDLLRSFAIVVMVIVHFTENLAGYTPLIAGLGAPTFLFLTGLSYRLWLNAKQARGVTETKIAKSTVRRGLFLFGLGFAFNVLVWLPEDTFNWDVLTLIGVGMITLNLARQLPPTITFLACLGLTSLTPLLQFEADWQAYWTPGYFDPDLTLTDVVLGFLVVGYFPIFPWLAFPLIGFLFGTFQFAETPDPKREDRFAQLGWQAGLTLMLLAVFVVLGSANSSGETATFLSQSWRMFPPGVAYMAGTLGFVLFAFGLSFLFFDRDRRDRFQSLHRITDTLSRHSLSAYLLHHIIHLYPLWIYGSFSANDPTAYWQKAMSVPWSLAAAIACLTLMYVIFRLMDRYHRGGIEAWMRWLCD